MNSSGNDASQHAAAHRSILPRMSGLLPYGLAILSVGVATGTGLLLQYFHFHVPGSLLLFAVAITSWYEGLRSAVLAAVLATLSFLYYFVEPVHTIYIYRSEIPLFLIFAGFAALLTWFGAVRRRIEADLREQTDLLNLTHDAIFVMNMEGVIKYWNQGAEEQYGWTAEQAVGRVVHDLLKTVPPAPLEQIKVEVTRTGRWKGELVHTRKDGTQLVVASRWSLQRNQDQTPVAILETNNDITERKRAEEAQTRLNRELRAISECNEMLLRATDEQSLVGEICRIICEEAGYRMAWVGYAEQDEAKTVRPVAWAGFEEGYIGTAGISWSEKDERGCGPGGITIRSGNTCYVQDFVTDPSVAVWREDALKRGYRSTITLPLKDEEGKTFGILTIYSNEPHAFSPEEIHLLEELAHDLAYGISSLRTRAERRRAEQDVSLLRFALDNVREAAFLIDIDAHFRYVNDEACRALGYTREELLGMGVPDIDPDYSLDVWADKWLNLDSKAFEGRHRTKQGWEFPVEVKLNYFEYEGESYTLCLVHDITERNRAEEEKARLQERLHQAQKMEAIGQLAGGVAHDFNNILGIINGYSEILVNRRQLDQEQRSQVEEILAAGQRAASLTRQLLAFSRKLLVQPKLLNLNSVIEGFDKMLRRLIGDDIEVRTILDPNLNYVNADPNQMEQVLLNFCINARDAMPEGGRITIKTANLEVNDDMAAQQFSLTPGRYLTLSVTDTGIGMDEDTQSHIFEPFFTTKGPEHGTGLGLATVYGIVKQSGGHVSVYSEPGRGSTFRVYLPAVSQETREREQITAPQELLRGTETVLLVEDAAALRALYRNILEDRGYKVLEAGDGESALQVAERYQGNIALLLSDVSLPKMKGPGVARILLQRRPKTKVLFMSGLSDDVVSGPDNLMPAAVAGFLQKPFAAEELFRKMREILDGQKPEMAA
jgi:PAS domain S-box-containing protein